METDLKAGDRIEYNVGSDKVPRWLSGRVVSVGKKRVRILVDTTYFQRNTLPKNLRREK